MGTSESRMPVSDLIHQLVTHRFRLFTVQVSEGESVFATIVPDVVFSEGYVAYERVSPTIRTPKEGESLMEAMEDHREQLASQNFYDSFVVQATARTVERVEVEVPGREPRTEYRFDLVDVSIYARETHDYDGSTYAQETYGFGPTHTYVDELPEPEVSIDHLFG